MSFPVPPTPLLRPVRVTRVPNEPGQYVIEDPAGYLAGPLQVSQAALVLLSLCDGSRNFGQIAADYEKHTGATVKSDEVRAFVASMDEAALLDSASFQAHKNEQLKEFRKLELLPASHAGGAYEADPELLHKHLTRLVTEAKKVAEPAPLCGLIAPHIDLHRGYQGYGQAYASLQNREAPDVVLVFGTGHAGEGGRYVLCDKGFATPLGDLGFDHEFYSRLCKRLPHAFDDGVLMHQTEHSIEFQALFLAHRYGKATAPTMIPILCTTFEDCMSGGRSPEEDPEVADFIGALQETVTEEERKLLVVAGADFSHVGPEFGDEDLLTDEFLSGVRARDLAALNGILAGDAEAFYESVAAHQNEHRICSVPSMYSMLRIIGASSGQLLGYDQAVAESRSLAVTYAGVAMFGSDSQGLALLG